MKRTFSMNVLHNISKIRCLINFDKLIFVKLYFYKRSSQTRMESFIVGTQYDDFKSLLLAKRNYEDASNCVLVICGSNKLKGDNDYVRSKVYDRLYFACKAGKERPPRGKGIRSSCTYKMNCPFKVNISLVKDKLTITNVNNIHDNHQTDRKTFLAYPESVKLTDNEIETVKPYFACGASKQKVKAFLSKNREAPVSLKSLHNLATKLNLETQGSNRKEDLARLIEMMLEIPNARVRIVTNVNGELIGVFFQDERMALFYGKYPEVIFFDATHRLNNLDMPLFIQLCVDGNGDSEIISLYVCVSESKEAIGSMLDEFKNLNPSWKKTKVILGDKDFADRMVYLEKFIDAVLKICIFHVQRTFRREITAHKRGITNAQREEVLLVLQRLVYSTSEEQYNLSYSELLALNFENVTSYYNDNWHNIRDEWTLFGVNEHCSYLNTTNNRLESLNNKLKLVGNRNANLQKFFENLTISISNASSEKDLKAVRGTMRKSRQCFDDETLISYGGLLTQFAFKKVEIQYELAELVKFLSIDEKHAIVNNKNYDEVSPTQCSCMFFSSMDLPCRHIFKFLIVNEMDPFTPELCANRWTMSYYLKSHPALASHVPINSTQPVYVQVHNDRSQIDRFKKSHAITKEIRDISTNLSLSERDYYMIKLQDLRNEMIKSSTNPISVSDECVENASNFCAGEQERNVNEEESSLPLDLSVSRPDGTAANEINVEPDENPLEMESNKENIRNSSQQNYDDVRIPIFKRSQQLSVVPSINNIKIPEKIIPPGRPKGKDKTAIGTQKKDKPATGTKRKKHREFTSTKKVNEDHCLIPFADKSRKEQVFTMITWLTRKRFSGHDKIALEEIVNNENVFQRLRNNEDFLRHLKEFVDDQAFHYIKDKVTKLLDRPWVCSKCKNDLEGYQVQCNVCLDWFHFKCVQDKTSSEHFICSSC